MMTTLTSAPQRKSKFQPFVWLVVSIAIVSIIQTFGGLKGRKRRSQDFAAAKHEDSRRPRVGLMFTLSGADLIEDEEEEEESADTDDTDKDESDSKDSSDSQDHTSAKAMETSLPLCSRDQIIKGKWFVERMKAPPYVTPTVHLRCYPKERYYPREGGTYETYKWQPEDKRNGKCEFTKWSSKAFCSLLPSATVAIIGDSLSWENFSSLVQLNGLKTKQGYQHQSRELHMNIKQSVCDGKTRLLYRRDDKLQELADALQEDIPTVLVLNRGAHYVNDTMLLEDLRQKHLPAVRQWLQQCHDLGIRCHLFWRTSVPGHPECGKFAKPVNDLAKMEARVQDLTMYDNRTINYHWYDYQRQNEMVLKELAAWQEEHDSFDYEVIDAYYLNMRRPDEHRAHQDDCLHSCYPGKMDVFSQLMLHYLKQQRTEADIHKQQVVAAKLKWKTDETTVYDPDATEQAKLIRESDKKGHSDS